MRRVAGSNSSRPRLRASTGQNRPIPDMRTPVSPCTAAPQQFRSCPVRRSKAYRCFWISIVVPRPTSWTIVVVSQTATPSWVEPGSPRIVLVATTVAPERGVADAASR